MEQFTIKHLQLNEYTHCEDEVSEGTAYGFWRVVEHTGAGWFPLPAHHQDRAGADRERAAMAAASDAPG